jgi:hypothetical protein
MPTLFSSNKEIINVGKKFDGGAEDLFRLISEEEE